MVDTGRRSTSRSMMTFREGGMRTGGPPYVQEANRKRKCGACLRHCAFVFLRAISTCRSKACLSQPMRTTPSKGQWLINLDEEGFWPLGKSLSTPKTRKKSKNIWGLTKVLFGTKKAVLRFSIFFCFMLLRP